MDAPTNSVQALALLQSLEQNIVLMKDGDWVPDDASCDASLEVILVLVQYVKQLEATTKLAAAAPRMLKALQWFIENDDTNIGMAGNEFWEDGLNEGIAAVAQAIGE